MPQHAETISIIQVLQNNKREYASGQFFLAVAYDITQYFDATKNQLLDKEGD